MIAASLRRFWDDTLLRILLWLFADKSLAKLILTSCPYCQPESYFFRFQFHFCKVLTNFSAKGVTTMQPAKTIQ